MHYKTPRQTLSKAYLKATVTRSEIEKFKEAFISMSSKVDESENEEHLKNVVRDFLLDGYYKGHYEINVKDRKDLVIHNGPKTSDSVGVIIEAKSIKNTAEMVSRENLNKKALQELILYYLRERVDLGNISVKHLIITNSKEWFVFNENDFEKLIFRNTKFLKQYKEYTLSGKNTDHFYTSIAKPFIETIKDEIEYTWFDISKYAKIVSNEDHIDDSKLIALYKFLSPTHILKKSFSNDSNSLNKDFYNELLHIIGLEEVKEKNKKIIQRKGESKREASSLIENTINILKYETKVPEHKHYETALELCITWINRILFLKLLESQIVKYHKGDKAYNFLNYDKIKDYDTLNRLFFQVLAIKPEDRRPKIKEAYSNVPYLNSSLFEVNDLEAKSLKISNLEDIDELSIYSRTVLKNDKGKRIEGKYNTLRYLFGFLEAYDFSSEGGEQIQEQNKTLINASVLGLIFEKINGYKDGSFFTPGFITMYMCKETIRRSVIQKFNDHTDFESEEWDELKNYIGKPYKKDELKQYNDLVDGIKICDPAVGSGHFLVSALNEIIAIKSELNILSSEDYGKLPILASVDNDELIILNDNEDHTLYDYDFTNKDSQTIQKALFNQKQKIIENCLFGVDINPNSVKICRLRLWIELLKNAYYTEESKFTDLETLPNIDINIKCGNSLISRFDLDSDLKPALKKSKFTIDSYKVAVASYKNATSKEEKQSFKTLIDGIKSDFRSEVRSKELQELQKLEGQFYNRFGQDVLIEVELSKTEKKKKEAEKKKLTAKIEKKKTEIEEVKNNKIYENAFEWRFEFPEVLDDEGDFVGFDVMIGNPPYVQLQSIKKVSEQLKKIGFETYSKMGDLYALFYERGSQILQTKGILCFITGSAWMRTNYGQTLRSYFNHKTNLIEVIDLSDCEIFESATVLTSIISFTKKQDQLPIKAIRFTKKDQAKLLNISGEVSQNHTKIRNFPESSWIILGPKENSIKEKIVAVGNPIKNWNIQINYGIKTGYNDAFVIDKKCKNRLIRDDPNSIRLIKPLLRGRDVHKYYYNDSELYLIGTFPSLNLNIEKYPAIKKHLELHLPKLKQTGETFLNSNGEKEKTRKKTSGKWFETQDSISYWEDFLKPKIIYPNMTKFLPFSLDTDNNFLNDKCFILSGEKLYYLTAFLNSKIFRFCFADAFPELQGNSKEIKKFILETIPVKEIRDENPFIIGVTEILEIKKQNPMKDTTILESKMDQLIFQLYNLTTEEIKIIENSIA